ncbi:MAG: DMT family transporter [Thermoanaerobaculia bacterium]
MATSAESGQERPSGLYLLVAFALFLVWSNSFIAASYLLGTEGRPARFDWVGITVARFLPIALLCLFYCIVFRRSETIRLLRHHPVRLVVCGLLGAPAYNLALYYGQQHGVPPPVASLTTALLPLFVMLLAAAVLGERLTARKITAFLVALVGLVIIALSKGDPRSAADYGLILGITALAPLSWAVYSILSKPIMGAASPLVWTYMTIAVGSIPLLAIAPWRGGPEMMALPTDGWVALLYLSVLCTLIGYAVWTWLLKHLQASTVGFTVFFNPPLTTASKLFLSLLFPAVFVWQLNPLELLGGGLSLAGLALALWPQR